MAIVIKMIWIFLWTYLLNCLCKKGFSTISWILVLIPFVAILGTIMLDLEGHKVHHIVVTTKEGVNASRFREKGGGRDPDRDGGYGEGGLLEQEEEKKARIRAEKEEREEMEKDMM
jgi:hypothetical protein